VKGKYLGHRCKCPSQYPVVDVEMVREMHGLPRAEERPCLASAAKTSSADESDVSQSETLPVCFRVRFAVALTFINCRSSIAG
jgi:hypothetical protein